MTLLQKLRLQQAGPLVRKTAHEMGGTVDYPTGGMWSRATALRKLGIGGGMIALVGGEGGSLTQLLDIVRREYPHLTSAAVLDRTPTVQDALGGIRRTWGSPLVDGLPEDVRIGLPHADVSLVEPVDSSAFGVTLAINLLQRTPERLLVLNNRHLKDLAGLARLLPEADVAFITRGAARDLVGGSDEHAAMAALFDHGARGVAIPTRSGAIAGIADKAFQLTGLEPGTVVHPETAFDRFVAGAVAARAYGYDWPQCILLGVVARAFDPRDADEWMTIAAQCQKQLSLAPI